MSQVVLTAQNRTVTGSGAARRIRRTGRIPGVLYGRSGQARAIDVDAQEFVKSIKHISESTIVTVEIEGTAYNAFVKDTQRNIQDGTVLHVDFYEVESGVMLRAKVSVHIHGNPVGVREGGTLELPLHEIEVECLPKDLPQRIAVDVSDLKLNQSIHVRDLALGEGVRIISGADQVVALVKFAKAEGAASSEEGAGEGASSETESKT
ncbi:MAG: 50S ribosomal protein L25 [Treponema sp.]|nr:50S ribosomal protein L25 [Treponema sp.]